MNRGDLEGIAIATYEQHGLDPSRPVSTLKLARLECGDEVLVCLSSITQLSRPAAVEWTSTGPRIGLREWAPPEDLNHDCGHELAHVKLRGLVAPRDMEDACDYLGACLMAPLPAIARLHGTYGWDVATIARAVCATQTWAALRVAEATNVPLISVSPGRIRARGNLDGLNATELRRLVRGSHPGLRKVRFTDRPQRYAIAANDAG